jgi:hypothetical protein
MIEEINLKKFQYLKSFNKLTVIVIKINELVRLVNKLVLICSADDNNLSGRNEPEKTDLHSAPR